MAHCYPCDIKGLDEILTLSYCLREDTPHFWEAEGTLPGPTRGQDLESRLQTLERGAVPVRFRSTLVLLCHRMLAISAGSDAKRDAVSQFRRRSEQEMNDRGVQVRQFYETRHC